MTPVSMCDIPGGLTPDWLLFFASLGWQYPEGIHCHDHQLMNPSYHLVKGHYCGDYPVAR
jgi:hypothetical protein